MKNTANLFPYQIAPAEALLASLYANGGALDASEMGTGKTAVACAVARHLACPTLAAVPAIAVTGWKKMAALFGVEMDIQSLDLLRGGNTPWGQWEFPRPKQVPTFLRCTACQLEIDPRKLMPCPAAFDRPHCVETRKREWNYGKFFWHDGIKLIIIDEIHKCSGLNSLQADMLCAAKRQRISVLGCSATACDSPLGMRAVGYVLGLHTLVGPKGFFPWAGRHGCRRVFGRGFQWWVGEEKKQRIMQDIHGEIFPARGARVRIADLGASFPACKITAELYDVAKPGRIDELYRSMSEAIAAVHEKREVEGDNALTALLRARMELELLKIPVIEELTAEAIAAGRSVAIFLNFRASVEELCRRLGTGCRVEGGQSASDRQLAIDVFQSDRSRVIVLSAAAGGVSIDLHDTRGTRPRLGLVSPGFSSRELKQIFGRLRRAGGVSPAQYRVIFCASTVEEEIHRAVSGKLDRLDLLNDGCLLPAGNLPLTTPTECGNLI